MFYPLYISSYAWMEAPMLSYCPCFIHSHTQKHTHTFLSDTHTLAARYCTLVGAVPVVLCVHLQHLQQRSFMFERLFSCNTKLISARSGVTMEVHLKGIFITSISFYNQGLTFGVLAIILTDYDQFTHYNHPLHCEYSNPCLNKMILKCEPC